MNVVHFSYTSRYNTSTGASLNIHIFTHPFVKPFVDLFINFIQYISYSMNKVRHERNETLRDR